MLNDILHIFFYHTYLKCFFHVNIKREALNFDFIDTFIIGMCRRDCLRMKEYDYHKLNIADIKFKFSYVMWSSKISRKLEILILR